jgi:hypothetical protein
MKPGMRETEGGFFLDLKKVFSKENLQTEWVFVQSRSSAEQDCFCWSHGQSIVAIYGEAQWVPPVELAERLSAMVADILLEVKGLTDNALYELYIVENGASTLMESWEEDPRNEVLAIRVLHGEKVNGKVSKAVPTCNA